MPSQFSDILQSRREVTIAVVSAVAAIILMTGVFAMMPQRETGVTFFEIRSHASPRTSGRDWWPVIQGLGTLTVAGIVAYIAWQQHDTARTKLKLDLFDRRYAIYRGLMDLFAAVEEGKIDAALPVYYKNTHPKRFLVDSDVLEFMDNVRATAVNFNRLHKRRAENPDQPPEQKFLDAESAAIDWLIDAQEKAAPVFFKHLDFRQL